MTVDLEKTYGNILLDRSLPRFIKDEYPKLVDFLKAYNEYLEQQYKPNSVIGHLRDYSDIDKTIDEFVKHFRKTYLVNIPSDIVADKRLLAKQIKNFYLNKSNEASYRFLFRILYNEDIEFYYPKIDILKASDGKWSEQKSLKITANDPITLTIINNSKAEGSLSGATAIVEAVLHYTDRNVEVIEIILSEIQGIFQDEEEIHVIYFNSDGEQVFTTEHIKQIFTGVIVTEGGSSYVIGDRIIIKNSDDQEIGKAIVLQTTKGSATGFNIIDGGLGYDGVIRQVDRLYALPINWNYNGTVIADSPIGALDSNDIDFENMTIDAMIDIQNVDGEGDIITIADAPNSTGGGFGIVTLVDSDGTILTVQLLQKGDGYQAPHTIIDSINGSGADIEVIGGGGSISKIKLEQFPVVLDSDVTSDGFNVYPDFTNSGDGNATGYVIAGALAEYPGRYLNEDGQLSSSKKLQDNFFYQDYSYVIKVGVDIELWRDIVKKIIHPAGLAVFGRVNIISIVDGRVVLNESLFTRKIISELGGEEPTIEDSYVKLYTISGGHLIPILDSNGNQVFDE